MALCSSNKGTIEQRIKCLTILIEAGANVNASNKQRYCLSILHFPDNYIIDVLIIFIII